MTPEEQAMIGEFAEQQVVNGEQAKGYSDYINGHLAGRERRCDVLGDQRRGT